MSRVYILLVNWNGWADTIECLESVFRLDYPDFRVVVCDNDSGDGSLERIKAWSGGNLTPSPGSGTAMRGLTSPPVAKPVDWVEMDRTAAEDGGDLTADPQLALIKTGGNLGFAGGNNVGLRYVLAKGDADYVWLLNNDTVVATDALQALVERMQAKPAAGICGSTVLNYWRSDRVDALGGAYYCRWLGLAWHLGRFRRFTDRTGVGKIEKRMDYVVGASMFVPMRFLQEVGLLDESFFLYYEELDWATRGKGRFPLAYAPESIVYHKIGGTIGTSSNPARKSLISDFYTLRNRLQFTSRRYPYALPTVYAGMLAALAIRLVFGQWRKARMVCRLLANPRRTFEQCVASR